MARPGLGDNMKMHMGHFLMGKAAIVLKNVAGTRACRLEDRSADAGQNPSDRSSRLI